MKSAFWSSRLLRGSLLALLACTLFAITTRDARAEILETGYAYTKPFTPKGKDERTIGNVVVQARVYARVEGTATDPWGTGIKDFDKLFIRGNDPTNKRSPELDRNAKYLYLYQVVYATDREQETKDAKQVAQFNAGYAPVHMVSIRLLVPTTHITSWGHLEEAPAKVGAVGKGVSFVLPYKEPVLNDTRMRALIPVAADPLAPSDDKAFKSPDTFLRLDKEPQSMVKGMDIRNEVKPVATPEAREQRAKADPPALTWFRGNLPSEVTLVPVANFQGADAPTYKPLGDDRSGAPPIQVNPVVGIPPFGGPMVGMPYYPASPYYGANVMPLPVGWPLAPGARPEDSDAEAHRRDGKRTFASLRVTFPDNFNKDTELNRGDRSSVFGFTSNDPPVEDVVRVRALTNAVIAVAQGEAVPVSALTGTDTKTVTPASFETGGAGTVGGTSFPMLGGSTGSIGGGGGSFPGGHTGSFGNVPNLGGNPGSGSGSGGGQGSGNGNTNGAQNQAQQQAQAQNQGGNTSPTSIRVDVQQNNSQIAIQQQQQQQQQKQKQQQQQQQSQKNNNKHNHHVQVVPEPAAVVTALLGLPAFFLLKRRRKTAE
jgi:hypothetical protein